MTIEELGMEVEDEFAEIIKNIKGLNYDMAMW